MSFNIVFYYCTIEFSRQSCITLSHTRIHVSFENHCLKILVTGKMVATVACGNYCLGNPQYLFKRPKRSLKMSYHDVEEGRNLSHPTIDFFSKRCSRGRALMLAKCRAFPSYRRWSLCRFPLCHRKCDFPYSSQLSLRISGGYFLSLPSAVKIETIF